MYSLFAALRRLFKRSPDDMQARDEAYLAQAVDMADLERRIRRLDRGLHDQILLVSGGLLPR